MSDHRMKELFKMFDDLNCELNKIGMGITMDIRIAPKVPSQIRGTTATDKDDEVKDKR